MKNPGVPVNPRLAGEKVLGEHVKGSLLEIGEPVDIVDVFRRSEFIPAAVRDALQSRILLIWFQLGLVHETAAEDARQAGRRVVQDRCIKVEHARLLG